MVQIQASAFTFAALLGDGLVVAWGAPHHGGDISVVQSQLQNVCSRSRPQTVLLLPFLVMGPSLHEVMPARAVTAELCRTG